MGEIKKVSIAVLGFGVVGSGVYKLIENGRDSIIHRELLDLNVRRVLVRDFENEPNIGIAPREVFTTDVNDIVSDPEISVVCECMGGTEPARTYILSCLKAGKTVVTSNKEVVAKHWPEFEAMAKETGAGFYIEATAGGGMPIIRTLIDAMPANNIDTLMGIVNGTTNYILTQMCEQGTSFEDALKEAQKLGFAEANPEADVEAWDCVYKLSILGSIAFHARVELDTIYREGITKIGTEDIAIARELGYAIRLLAIGKKTGGHHGKLELRVHPTLIPLTHPIANVRDAFNAVFLHGDSVGDIMLYGRGAGQMPTASAIVADVIYASKAEQHRYMTFDNTYGAPQTLTLQKDWTSSYSIRISVEDNVGVLENIARVFAQSGVSIHSMMQRGDKTVGENQVSIIIITHEAKELALRTAVDSLNALECVTEVKSVLRVER